MKISYNWLQSFFSKKLPSPEKLADLLTMHSFETELVGKAADDQILEIDITPSRAHDAAGHFGIAREISALLKIPLQEVDWAKKIKPIDQSVSNLVKVEVNDKQLCPRYTAKAIVDVKVADSPDWIKDRLKACGLRPISNVVDITNYVMLETGQPLHAFDADKLDQKTIIVRRAKKGEAITTLDNEKYDLDQNILVIADKHDPVGVAGIKGGKKPEIDKSTKRVILEAAHFNPKIIRQASNQLKLKTDASWRFERQTDPNLTGQAIDMAAFLIQDIAGGQVLKEVIDIYPNKLKEKSIILDSLKVKSLLGLDISISQSSDILKRLGFASKISGQKLKAIIPTRRLDISNQEDLIEEIGRVYGYEQIKSKLPMAVLVPSQRNEDLIYLKKTREILTAVGFSEVYNYSFVGDKELGWSVQKPRVAEMANPVSQDQKYLRPNLILNLLNNVSYNKKYFSEVRLFEIGKVFKNSDKFQEVKKLAAVLDLSDNSPRPEEFYQLKGVVESLLNKLRITDVWYDDQIDSNDEILNLLHPNRRAEVKVGSDLLGFIGEIDKSVGKKAGLDSRTAVFELDFEKLVGLATEERSYQAPSKYPAVTRDISLLVDSSTKVVQVMNLIHAAGGKLVKDIDLFDMYQGDNIEGNKKSLAFHIVFQADDRSLTDKEVNKIREKIFKALEQEGGWQIRR